MIEDIPEYSYRFTEGNATRTKLAHLRSMGIERMSQSATGSPESTASFIDALMGQSPNLHTPYIIRALQRINPAVKVVAMSSTSANESIVERYALGAFLTKLFTTTAMLHTLANLELPL
jgi:two-component system, cell cycle sensor histidine kinase and response regulator CckA